MTQSGPQRGSMLDWPTRRPWLTLGLLALLAVLSLVSISRMRVNTSLDVLFARDDASSQALARVITHFNAIDNLLLVVSITQDQPVNPSTTQKLLDFADRFQQAVQNDDAGRPMVTSLQYEVAADTRQFIEAHALPALAWYLDDAAFERLKHRLTPSGIAEQFAQNEAMMTAPGAGDALARLLIADPLRIRELALERFTRMSPPMQPYQGLPGSRMPFISPDGRHLLIAMTGSSPVSDMDFVLRFTDAMNTLAMQANHDQLSLAWTGGYAIAREAQESIRGDMIVSTTTSIIFIQILFLLAYRHLASFPLAFAPVVLGLLLGFGAFAALGFELTAPIAVIGGMLAGMAIDYALHFLSHYHQMGQPQGVASRMIRPLLAAFITTAATFVIIALSGVQALRDFALLGMMGLGFSLLASVTLLPAMLSLMHRWRPGRTSSFAQPRINFNRPLFLVARGPKLSLLLGLSLLVTLATIIASSPQKSVRLDPDIRAMHPQPNEALAVQDRLTEQFGLSPEFLVVHQQADSPEQLIALSHRVRSSLLTSSASAQAIRSMLGLADLLPDPDTFTQRQQALQALDPDAILARFNTAVEASIFEPTQFADYQVFLRRMLRPEPPPSTETLKHYPQLAMNLLPRESSSARAEKSASFESLTFIWLHQPLDQRSHRQVTIDALREALEPASDAERNQYATLTGISVVAQDTEHVIASGLLRLSFLAAAGVLTIVLLTFRSVRDALLALLPVVMSIAAVLAVMRVTETGFNLINLIGLPLLVGVSVDYGIFLVSSARQVHDASLQRVDRMGINAHASSLCCITTILGFGSIITAGTPAIASLGLVLCSGMIGTMAGALLLTAPALLIQSPRKEAQS